MSEFHIDDSVSACALERRDGHRRCEEAIRAAPLRAVGIAFLVGLLFRVLPVAAILGALLRLAVSLVRPALLVLGVAKSAELLCERTSHR
jgi:hypothetical protein